MLSIDLLIYVCLYLHTFYHLLSFLSSTSPQTLVNHIFFYHCVPYLNLVLNRSSRFRILILCVDTSAVFKKYLDLYTFQGNSGFLWSHEYPSVRYESGEEEKKEKGRKEGRKEGNKERKKCILIVKFQSVISK